MSKKTLGTDPAELQARMEPWVEEIEYGGKLWQIKRRGLTWPQKKRAISESCTWDDKGKAIFDWDKYYRICLKAIIVEAPFEIDDVFLTTMAEDFGELLERLCPNPWPDITLEKAKKD